MINPTNPINPARHVSSLASSGEQPARPEQRMDHAGGYGFALDRWAQLDLWAQLDRWLVLGCETGTYHAAEPEEPEMTRDETRTLEECLAVDGARTVARIVERSVSGREPTNTRAVFALALATGHPDLTTRRAALAAIPRVCKTSADLFRFVRDVEGFRRWGRGLRGAIAAWYNHKPASLLARLVLAHREGDGWSHRDLLRLSHPKAPTPEHDALYRWIVSGSGAVARDSDRAGPSPRAESPR